MTGPAAPFPIRSAPLICLGVGGVFALTPWASPALALAAGLACALGPGNPWSDATNALSARLLQLSIVALGFGLHLEQLVALGLSGAVYTALSIAIVFALGLALGRWLRIERTVSVLVTTGTSICGGSAIAAMAPVIGAGREAAGMALATVFILNAVALYLFPPIGHALGLSQHQFGVWAAMAIHDTSSVVGAAATFGLPALQDATILKLVRALWILPLVVLTSVALRTKSRTGAGRLPIPWFVAGFVVAATVRSVVPESAGASLDEVAGVGRTVLVLTLFLIGASLSSAQLRRLGLRPFLHGLALWVLVAAGTLAAVVWSVPA